MEALDGRHADDSGNDANGGVDGAALRAAYDALGFNPVLAPTRREYAPSESTLDELAASLHSERVARLAAEDKLTPDEIRALSPLLSTFRSNCIPQRDIKTVLEQLLMIRRLRCAFRHAPGVKSPDTLRQRFRSLSLREQGSRFSEIYEVARASNVFRVSVLERLRELAEASEALRTTVFQKRHNAGLEARRRADARS